jgi:ribosomal-protein-alanine N-acetyltransferase
MVEHTLSKLDITHLDAMMTIEKQCHSHPLTEKLMRSCLSGRYSAFGLYSEDTLVAFYIVEQAGPDYTLMDICVTPNQQGKGLARIMIKHLQAFVASHNGENIFLEVRASNERAISLYEQSDFIEYSIRKDYYPAENGKEDAVLMMFTNII